MVSTFSNKSEEISLHRTWFMQPGWSQISNVADKVSFRTLSRSISIDLTSDSGIANAPFSVLFPHHFIIHGIHLLITHTQFPTETNKRIVYSSIATLWWAPTNGNAVCGANTNEWTNWIVEFHLKDLHIVEKLIF